MGECTVRDSKPDHRGIIHRSVRVRFNDREWSWDGEVDTNHFREFGDQLQCAVPCRELGCEAILYTQTTVK